MSMKSMIAKWLVSELSNYFSPISSIYKGLKENDVVEHDNIEGRFKVIRVNSTRVTVLSSEGKERKFRRHLITVVSRPTQKGEPNEKLLEGDS